MESTRRTRRRSRLLLAAAAVAVAAAAGACRDEPTSSGGPQPVPPLRPKQIRPVGVVEVTISGIGTQNPTARAVLPPGLRAAVTPPANGDASGTGSIQLEAATNGSFTEGTRGVDGQRYVFATFRVRNADEEGNAYDTPRQNLTFLAIRTAATLGGGAVSSLKHFDGSDADSAMAANVVPTGAVELDDSLKMRARFADVLQVLTEAEAAAVPRPGGVTDVLPYGFVVRNASSANSRTLPASPGPNQFDGQVTFAFRVPLQATIEEDAYTISMLFLAVDDGETRVTESIEEQDPVSRARVAARASELGATTVTVLDGSVSTYGGMRKICAARVSGASGSPAATINAPGAFSRISVLGPGQALDACAGDFRTGPWSPVTGDVLGTRVKYGISVFAMDRYGHVKTAAADSVTLSASNPATLPTFPVRVVLTAGAGADSISFAAYGTTDLVAVGRRQGGRRPVNIDGINRTWTGGAGTTDWSTDGNWNVRAAPDTRDTAIVPDTAPLFPQLSQVVSIAGLRVLDLTPGGTVPTVALQAFNLTATGDVLTTSSASVTNTSGVLILAGMGRTVAGTLPRIRVTGTYSLAGNVTMRAPLQVQLGRARNQSFRIRATSF
ncbi:MAG TPA: hypothetical protein VFR81_30500 [Longimicrobium sp.]|nr:hypothetical protein [Longimicrobium sp.]